MVLSGSCVYSLGRLEATRHHKKAGGQILHISNSGGAGATRRNSATTMAKREVCELSGGPGVAGLLHDPGMGLQCTARGSGHQHPLKLEMACHHLSM